MDLRIIYLFCVLFIIKANGQCTFQSPFASSTWHDSTRGTLTFGTTTVSGWSITVLNQAISTWQCVDSSTSTNIVLRSTGTISYSSTAIYVYLCMQLTKISDYSYYYYQQHAQEGNAAFERLKFSTSSSLTLSEVCDSSVTVPTLEFHVLVLQGSESLAAVTCGDTLLYTTDYSYNDGTNTACANTTDSWDVCTSTNQMTFDYTTCSQQIAFSAGGQLTCVANMEYNGYHCSVVYNQDASVSDGSATRRFSCICSSGSSASVAPDNCTAVQSPTVLPTEADGTTVVGHLLTYETQYTYCGPVTPASSESSSNVGAIVGAVIGVLIVVGIVVGISIYCYLRHRKNKVDEVEKPILTNGSSDIPHDVPRVETVTETSRKPIRRERTGLSSSSAREKSDLDKSLIQRNATMTSIGLSMKREKSNITQVEPIKQDTEKDTSFKDKLLTLLPCFKKEEADKKLQSSEAQKENKKSKDGPLAVLPCFNKSEQVVKQEAGKEEPTTEPILEKKIKSVGKKTKPAKGKAGKKAEKGKPKSGTGKKTKGSAKDKKEEIAITDVGDTENIELVKREKTDVLRNQIPQATSTPIPKPKTSQKSPRMSKKKLSQAASEPIPVHDSNGHGTNNTPFVANGKTTEANPKSKDWTFLQCFGNKTSATEGTEAVEEVHEEQKHEPVKAKTKAKAPPKGKPVAKKAKKGGKASMGKPKKENKAVKSEKNTPRTNNSTENTDDIHIDEIEEVKLERAKTMPERTREKTALSIVEADKVKVDVYVPNENSPLTLKDTVLKVKEQNGDLQPTEKAKSSLGLARPTSAISKTSSKKIHVKSTKKDKKSTKNGKTKKDTKETKDKKEKKNTKKKK